MVIEAQKEMFWTRKQEAWEGGAEETKSFLVRNWQKRSNTGLG